MSPPRSAPSPTATRPSSSCWKTRDVIVVLEFLPVFLLEGLAGSFFRPLALSYVLAIAASLGVALTVTPAMSLLLLPNSPQTRESPAVKWLKKRYRKALPRLVGAPRIAIAIVAIALAATAAAYPLLGEEFLPNFKEYDFLMHFVEKPGTSLEAMTRITRRASRELRAIPGVRNFGAHIGRAEVADEVVGVNFTELWISLDPKVDYAGTVARIQSAVDGYPGLQRDLLTYLRERNKEVLTGASATIVVRIFGPNLDMLARKAAEVSQAIAKIQGAVDVKAQALTMVPQVEVRFRPEQAQRVGITPAAVRQTVATMLRGAKVSHYRHLQSEEGIPFGRELVLRGAEERLAPIAMTALVTGLALVPIIAGGNRSGHEIEHPMAVVILGGLFTSTLLNLFLLPAIYLRFGARRRQS